MSFTTISTITLTNDVQQVPQLADFVEQVCEQAGAGMALAMQLNLAIEEAVVNVMNYAYAAGTVGTVEVQARSNGHELVFVITDSGIPFDPTVAAQADTTLSAEERPIGGLGIFLVRQLMDRVEYERQGCKNVLTLTKNLQQQP